MYHNCEDALGVMTMAVGLVPLSHTTVWVLWLPIAKVQLSRLVNVNRLIYLFLRHRSSFYCVYIIAELGNWNWFFFFTGIRSAFKPVHLRNILTPPTKCSLLGVTTLE